MLQREVNGSVFENNTFETLQKWLSTAKRFPVAAIRKVKGVVLNVLDLGEELGLRPVEEAPHLPNMFSVELVLARNEDVAICANEHRWVTRI